MIHPLKIKNLWNSCACISFRLYIIYVDTNKVADLLCSFFNNNKKKNCSQKKVWNILMYRYFVFSICFMNRALIFCGQNTAYLQDCLARRGEAGCLAVCFIVIVSFWAGHEHKISTLAPHRHIILNKNEREAKTFSRRLVVSVIRCF